MDLRQGQPRPTTPPHAKAKALRVPLPPQGFLTLAGTPVHSAAGVLYLICVGRNQTLPLIRTMAACKPARVVGPSAGFAGNDQLEANAVQIIKAKVITSFKAVRGPCPRSARSSES